MLQNRDFVEEVLFPSLLEVGAAACEDVVHESTRQHPCVFWWDNDPSHLLPPTHTGRSGSPLVGREVVLVPPTITSWTPPLGPPDPLTSPVAIMGKAGREGMVGDASVQEALTPFP